jgi:hypothetical protein
LPAATNGDVIIYPSSPIIHLSASYSKNKTPFIVNNHLMRRADIAGGNYQFS